MAAGPALKGYTPHTMTLSAATLRALPESVHTPTYDRTAQAPGVVHLGLGAFHRAHQAMVFDQLLASGDTRWGIHGVGMTRPDLVNPLRAQDGLYAVRIADAKGVKWQVPVAVDHLIADIIEISDEKWRAAAEGVLRGSRWVVVLDKATQEAQAMALAERERFRHYIVADAEEAPAKPVSDSLLAVLKFSAPAPRWLLRQLASIRRVPSTEAGVKLGGEWITPDAYHRDNRGGRSVWVISGRIFATAFGHDVQLAIRQGALEFQRARRGGA